MRWGKCWRAAGNTANQELHAKLQAKVAPSDVVQETFLEAQRDFPVFEGNSERELLAWLRQILLNNIHDTTRRFRDLSKRKLSCEVSMTPQDGSAARRNAVRAVHKTPSWFARLNEERDMLRQALERLSADHRQMIVLRNLELKSFVEIGRTLNRKPDAVRKLWVRALEALDRELGDFDAE